MKEIKQKKNRTYIDVKFRGIFIASTFSMLVEYLMSLSDKIISGNIIGFEALSAITLVEPFTMIAGFLACVLADITGAPVTEAIGKGDQKKAEQYLSQSLFLALVMSILLSGVYVVFTDQLVHTVAGTTTQVAYVKDYFYWLRFYPFPLFLNAVLYSVVLYRGGEMYCNLSAAFSVLSNIGLSIGLCFQSGLKGIGAATVIGSWMGLIPFVLFLLSPKGKMHLAFHFSFRDLKDNLVYSLGGSLNYLYMAVFQMILNLFLVKHFSDSALVVFTGVINLVGLITALSDGIVEFLIPMLNTYKGEKNELGCRKTMEKAIKASITESLILTVIVLIFARMFAFVFGVEDPELAGEFARGVRIYILSACCFYVTDLYSKYYLYMGKTILFFSIDFFKSMVFPTVFGIGFGMLFGLRGVWVGMSLAQLALIFACFWVIRRNKAAGKDLLFLNTDKMKQQHMWNIKMEKAQIMQLVEEICDILKEEGVPQKQINKAALVVEESQMQDLLLNKNAEKVVIECSMLEGEDITLILRNTGISNNILNGEHSDSLPGRIISRMPGVANSYILVNGNNRLIFHISKKE